MTTTTAGAAVQAERKTVLATPQRPQCREEDPWFESTGAAAPAVVNIHWTDEDDEDLERWYEERVERAGGPLLHYAAWKQEQDEWEARTRALCAEKRTTKATDE